VTYRKSVWKNLAFVARYGRVPPSEAGDWANSDLVMFMESLGELIGKENAPED
jgi:hypothetical protein